MKKTIITGAIAGSLLLSGKAMASECKVKPEDWSISKSNKIKISQLHKANEEHLLSGKVVSLNGESIDRTKAVPIAASKTYVVKSGDTFSEIAQEHGLTTAALKALNPGIRNMNMIQAGQVLNISLSQNGSSGSSSVKSTAKYTVKSGDTLSGIASKHGMSLSALLKLNTQITNPNVLRVGQVIRISGAASGNSSSSANGNTSSSTGVYTVKQGDTLSGIASKHGMSLSALLKLNTQISNPNVLNVGQAIKVSGSVSSSGNSSSSGSNVIAPSVSATYTIKSGDTLSAVAKAYKMNLSTLLSLNPEITNPSVLKVGQVIKVSGKVSSESESGSTTAGTVSSWEKKADSIIASGKKYLGVKYVYGASPNRTDAFDCSSFVMRAFSENGISLPRTSAAQSQQGSPIAISSIRKGDLIFFDTDYNGTVNHVGIVVNSSTMLHCGSSTGVTLADLNSYWMSKVVKVRRMF